MSSPREQAATKGEALYLGQPCEYDGTREYFTSTGKCACCTRYAAGVAAGRVIGKDGRNGKKKQKSDWQRRYDEKKADMPKRHSQKRLEGYKRRQTKENSDGG